MRLRLLFLILTVAGFVSGVFADNKCFVYSTPGNDGPLLGNFRRISANKQWAVGGDEADHSGCFYVKLDSPEDVVLVEGGLFMDVSNDGTIVGAKYSDDDTYAQHAAIYKNGEWIDLVLPEGTMGQSCAVAITPDGKRIGGYIYVHAPEVETGLRYYPAVWDWDENEGTYIPKVYNDQPIPEGMQGFIVYDMSPDGNTLCGTVNDGAGSWLPAIIRNGKLKMWHTSEVKSEPFEYQGKVIGYFDEYYINGMHDGAEDNWFNDALVYATDKYLFGYRTEVQNPNYEEGTGTYVMRSTVYDIEKDEFTDSDNGLFTCGIDKNAAFGLNAYVNGESKGLENYFGFTCPEKVAGEPIAYCGVFDVSEDQSVLAGEVAFFNEVVGEYVSSPMLVVRDASSGITNIGADASRAVVKVVDGTIVVGGANSVAVYNGVGALVSNASTTSVKPGIYVVVADNKATKIVVK